MFRLTLALLLVLPVAAMAQQRDSVFKSYETFGAYVDDMVMKRDFIPLVQTLGGRDEYTPEQLGALNGQLMAAFPVDFNNSAVFRREDLGGGVVQEARIYWSGESYAFFYAILHQRKDDIVVLNFNLNTSISTIMAKF